MTSLFVVRCPWSVVPSPLACFASPHQLTTNKGQLTTDQDQSTKYKGLSSKYLSSRVFSVKYSSPFQPYQYQVKTSGDAEHFNTTLDQESECSSHYFSVCDITGPGAGK